MTGPVTPPPPDTPTRSGPEPPGGVRPRGRKSGSTKNLSGVATYTALANLALPLTSLISGPLLARALGPEGRGEVVAVMAPLFVLMFVANMGLPEATTFGIARLRVAPRQVLGRVLRLSLLYGVTSAGLLWLAAPALLWRAPDAVPLLRSALPVLPLLMSVILLRFATNGMRNFATVGIERVLTPIARLSAFLALAVLGSLTVATTVAAQIGATLLGGAFLAVAFRRATREPVREPAPADADADADASQEPDHRPGLTRTLAAYGARGWGGVFGNLVNWRLDQAVLVALVAPAQLGFYAVAVHFAELPATMVNAVRNVLFAESAHRDDVLLINRAVRAVVALTVAGALVGAAVAPTVVRLLFGDAFAPAVPIAQVLVVASIPFATEQVVAAGLLASGHPGRRSIGQVSAAVLTVTGLVLLAPPLGALGAALTSLTAYTVSCAVAIALYRRVTGVRLRDLLLPGPADVRWLLGRVAGLLRRARRRARGRTPAPDPDPQ